MAADTVALKSIDGIINEVLRLISYEENKTKNLAAFRNLYLPTTRFSVLNPIDSISNPF